MATYGAVRACNHSKKGPLPFACLESGRAERGEGRKKKEGGGGGGIVNECGDGVGGGYVYGVGG